MNTTSRLYAVLNKRLENLPFVAGEYSIAGTACYPWIVPHGQQGQDLANFPHLTRWFEAIRGRARLCQSGGDQSGTGSG